MQLFVLLEPVERFRHEVRVDAGDDAGLECAGAESLTGGGQAHEASRVAHGKCRDGGKSIPKAPRNTATQIALEVGRESGTRRRQPERQRNANRRTDSCSGRVERLLDRGEQECFETIEPLAAGTQPGRARNAHRIAGVVDHVRMLGERADSRADRCRARPGVPSNRRRGPECGDVDRPAIHVRRAPAPRIPRRTCPGSTPS